MIMIKEAWPDTVNGYTPKIIHNLPSDITALQEGDWKFSDQLLAWVGWESENNLKLYLERIA